MASPYPFKHKDNAWSINYASKSEISIAKRLGKEVLPHENLNPVLVWYGFRDRCLLFLIILFLDSPYFLFLLDIKLMMMTEPVSLKTKLYTLFQERQFYWWLGHVCCVCNGLFYFSSVLSLNTNNLYYKRAYLGVLLSYAVVIYNSIGATCSSFLSVNVLCDENVHYFVIAFYWYSYRPMTVTLIPFFVFSIFHTLTFTRTNLIPLIVKPMPLIDSKIKHFTDNYHKTAMQYAAYIEVVVVLGRIIIGVLLFRTSVLALIVFIHFLRLRYYLSSYTREAIQYATLQLDHWLLSSNNEQVQNNVMLTVISNMYLSAKRLVVRYGSVPTIESTSK